MSIISVTTYVQGKLRINDNTLDDCVRRSGHPRQTRQSSSQPLSSLGQIDNLPSELLIEVLSLLSVPDLMAFRRVNRLAAAIVGSLPRLCKIMDSCGDVIEAIVATATRSFTLDTLFRTLSIPNCASCGQFGGYVYLITCTRVCYSCFSCDTAYFPITEAAARRMGCRKRDLERSQHLISLPGTYTCFGKVSKRRIKLFDREQIRRVAQDERWNAVAGRQVDYTTREPKRYMAIVAAPYLGPGGEIDWGVHCLGCQDFHEPSRNLRTKYSESGIVEHLQRFGLAQQINGRTQHVV